MSVYRPKKSPYYHYDFWVSGVRFSGSTERAAKSDAKKVEAEEREKANLLIERQRAGKDAPMTIAAAADRYWNEVGQHHANARTTLFDLNRLVTYFGPGKPLVEIRDTDVATLVAWRRGHKVPRKDRQNAPLVSPATVNRSTTEPLQKIFNRAIGTWNVVLPEAPRWRRHLLKEPDERVREVRPAEEGSFAALRDDYRAVIAFARASGLRMAECLLRKEDVDLIRGVVRTIGKGGKRIVQPITTEMRAILMAEMANPTDYVFTYVAARAGRGRGAHRRGDRLPITLSGLKTVWRRARDGGLPPDLRFHDMRHDFATKLLRTTSNLKLVMKALNHSKIETTGRYAHVLDDEVLAGMEAASQQRAGGDSAQKVPKKVPNQTRRGA